MFKQNATMAAIFGMCTATTLAPGQAAAGAIHSASAEAVLTITGISNLDTPGDLVDLFIAGDTVVGADFFFAEEAVPGAMSDASTDGFAEVLGADPDNLGVGDGLLLHSGGDGATSGPGSSIAVHMTEGLLFVDNFSFDDAFAVEFSLEYSLTASPGIEDPATEFAFSIANIDAFTDFDDIAFDEIASFSDTGGGALMAGPVELDFTLTLDPNTSDLVTVLAGVETGAIVNPVSAPPSIGHWLAAGLGLIWLRRRKDGRPAPTVPRTS